MINGSVIPWRLLHYTVAARALCQYSILNGSTSTTHVAVQVRELAIAWEVVF